MPYAHPITRVLGAGQLWFDLEDADGNNLGLRYLGDTPGFTLTLESETVDTWSSDGQVAEREDLAITRVIRNCSITCKQISDDNLGLFLMGSVADLVQTGGAVTDEAIDGVLQGRRYHLGASSSNPAGNRTVSALTVTDDDTGAPTTFVLNTDYEIDLDTGALFIVPGGGIADDTNLLVDYTKGSVTRAQVTSSDVAEQYGALRFYADNTRGANRNLYAPRVLLRPTGELAFKSREGYMEMQFACEFMKRTGFAQAYIDGVPAAT
jgi:hypothetical protein